MNQSIDLLLKARESLQQFRQQYTNQSQDTVPQEKHENSKPEKIKQEKIKNLDDLLRQNISNAYRRQSYTAHIYYAEI